MVYGYVCEPMDPCVYFIQDGEGHIKIGMTNNIKDRMAALKQITKKSLKLLAKFDTGSRFEAARLEKELHERFKKSNYQDEWFYEDPVIEYLRSCQGRRRNDGQF